MTNVYETIVHRRWSELIPHSGPVKIGDVEPEASVPQHEYSILDAIANLYESITDQDDGSSRLEGHLRLLDIAHDAQCFSRISVDKTSAFAIVDVSMIAGAISEKAFAYGRVSSSMCVSTKKNVLQSMAMGLNENIGASHNWSDRHSLVRPLKKG
jgi:hypothetical protein